MTATAVMGKTSVKEQIVRQLDSELAGAQKIREATNLNQEKWGDKRVGTLECAFGTEGAGQPPRGFLRTIVGDGIHASSASLEVVARYDGWALMAHCAGEIELANKLRQYIVDNDGADGMLVDEVIEYLQGVREIVTAS